MAKDKKKAKKDKPAKTKKVAKVKKAPVVEATIETPIEEAPALVVEAEKVAEPVEAEVKPVKAKKTMAVSDFHFDPPETKWERKPVDTGWRSYRLWTNHELDWDDKDDDEAKMKSIRACIAKSKAALVKELAVVPETSLVVKTDLKADEYPFEPFIEVWILREKEGETLSKMTDLTTLSVMDADFDGDVVEPVKETKDTKEAA